MRAPLDQFADRIIRCGEVGEFLHGLLEKGVPVYTLQLVIEEERGAEAMRQSAEGDR